MAPSKKVVVVFGATGKQGGSVVRALLHGEDFHVRAVTRNTASEKAQALKTLGAELATADFDDPETLGQVMLSAHACFVVTNFWEHMDPQKETTQGKNIVDAAVLAGVDHVIYSGLESIANAVGLSVPHFDAKAEVEDYMREKGVPFTSVRMSAYYENFLGAMKPRKLPDGSYILGIPMEDVPMYGISVDDVGEVVRSILMEPEEYKGKCIGLAGDRLTSQDHVDVFSKILAPRVFKDAKMTAAQFSQLKFPGAEDLANMFTYYQKGNPSRDINLTKKLNPDVKTFEKWVTENKTLLLAALETEFN